MENGRASQAAKAVTSASSNACMDWVKTNWMWLLIGAAVIAGLAYWFLIKKKKGVAASGSAIEGAPKLSPDTNASGMKVTRAKPTGGPEY